MKTLLGIITLSITIGAQCPGPSTVYGFIRLEDERGLVGADVQLQVKTSSGYQFANGVRTGKRGAYSFSLDPCSVYRLAFTSKRFDITNLMRVPVTGADVVEVDVTAWGR